MAATIGITGALIKAHIPGKTAYKMVLYALNQRKWPRKRPFQAR
jgi:hypothetical protein